MRISHEDYDKVCEEKKQIKKRLQEEMLFDQLATAVIEWHEAMVKFAARADAASPLSYPMILKNIRECNLMLRIATILSTALSFTENVEDDDRHNKHQCGKPICTIARELRNGIQHSWIQSQQPSGGWTNMRLTTPQMDKMPANSTKNSVTLSIPLQEVRDDLAQKNQKKRAERFERACEQEFPNRDSLDMVIVINGYLQCLSDVINKRRMEQPIDEFLRTHTELLERPTALNDMYAVSPDGEKISINGISQMQLVEIKELLDRNQNLPDLELIQFGGGSPTIRRRRRTAPLASAHE